MTPPFRKHHRYVLTLGSLALALLASGCATTAPDSKLPAVYCVNAPGAGPAPSSVPAAYCTNLRAAAGAPATATVGQTTEAPAADDSENTSTTAPGAATSASSAAMIAAPTHGTSEQGSPTASASASYRPPGGALTLAPEVDLNRYMGRWYVIANIPYAFDNGDVGAYVEYKRDGDNIEDVYYAHRPDFDHPLHERKGQAYVVKNTHNAEWRVTYLWPVYTSYKILYVDPDYQFALVGYPGRSLGWVYARSPHVDDAKLKSLLARFAADGYDVSQFRRVPQTPEQVRQ